MKHSRTHILKTTSAPVVNPVEPIEQCYRAVLDTSDSAIVLLSPGFIILGWNQTAATVSGWTADEALGRHYAELCLSTADRAPFLAELERVAEGSNVKGLESPLHTRGGLQTMVSWNISRVQEGRGRLIGLMAIGTVLVPHSWIEEELRLARAQLGHEARHAQAAVEDERRRIARELHDEFGQTLTDLKFDLAWLELRLAPSPASPRQTELSTKVRDISDSVDALLASVRATAKALHPVMLDDLGLIPALDCLATTFRQQTSAKCDIVVAPELSSMNLPPDISLALFRIAQESLTNVMRHADASLVRIRLFREHDIVTLEVMDNGTGIQDEKTSGPHAFGLRGMQERVALLGGHFEIVGTPRAGTVIRASLPLEECWAS